MLVVSKQRRQREGAAYVSTASSVIHLEELAQHEGVVVGVANLAGQALLHVGQHVRQPLAAAHTDTSEGMPAQAHMQLPPKVLCRSWHLSGRQFLLQPTQPLAAAHTGTSEGMAAQYM